MKTYKNSIMSLILALVLTFFTWHSFFASGSSIIFLLMFVAFYFVVKNTIKHETKRKFIIASIISIIFAIIEVICKSINYDFSLDHILDHWLILNLFGYSITGWLLLSNLYNLLTKIRENNNETTSKIKIGKISIDRNSKKIFWISFVLILIAWIPYFFRYYPGLLTSDSCAEVLQGIGRNEFSNHHPILHVSIIAVFVNIGLKLFNNINTGVAFYSIFQMIVMSALFASVISYLVKKNVKNELMVLMLLWYMFYPVNGLFSVIMWKDIIFAGIVPIFVLNCYEMLFNREKFFEKKTNYIKVICISLLMIYMRNNGIYIFVLSLLPIICASKKYWKNVLVVFIVVFLLHTVINFLLFNVIKIKKGSSREMLSIPVQQMARTIKYNNDIDQSLKDEFNEFFTEKDVWEKYNPVLSDPVKNKVDDVYFKNNKGKFIKLWLKLMRVSFKDYVESFISNSYGYYYPETSHWVANRTMEENNIGLEQTPIINGKIVSKVDSFIERRDIPILTYFFSIGLTFWIVIALMGYNLLNKDYRMLFIYVPILVLWLTLIASPVFCEFRYAYPIFTTIPLYFGVNLKREEEINK